MNMFSDTNKIYLNLTVTQLSQVNQKKFLNDKWLLSRAAEGFCILDFNRGKVVL